MATNANIDPHDQSAEPTSPTLRLIIIALLPFAAGYFLSYLFRAVNAVVAPSLVGELGLTAGSLGLLTAAYLAAFALFQLPLGVLLDRYGPRRVQAILVGIGSIGAALFAVGESVTTLVVARAIIGLGFSGGLMAGFKAVIIWVPPERRALFNAWVMAAGAVGLIVSTVPTQVAVDAVGWRMVFAVLAAITFAVAIWIWFGVPSRPSAAPAPPPLATQISQLGTLMRDPIFLAVAPMLALTAGTQIAVQTLWAGPWLRDVAGLDEQGVADLLAFAAIAFLVGVLVSGTIADRLQARGVSLLTTMMGFLVLFIAAQAALIAEWLSYNALIWFIYGMSGQVAVLAYPWLAQYFGAERAGRSNAAINLSLFATAFALQYAIGLIIDLYPKVGDGYPPEAYRMAFAIALAMQLAAVLWFLRHRAEIRKIDLAFRSGAHVSSSRRG